MTAPCSRHRRLLGQVPNPRQSANPSCRGSAACVGLGGELFAEDEEQSTELGALRLGEAGEELVLGVALCLRGAFELLFAASGDGDDVPTAVVCVAFACQVVVGFERV